MWIVYSEETIDGTGHKKVGKIMTEVSEEAFILPVSTTWQQCPHFPARKEPLPQKKANKKTDWSLCDFLRVTPESN